MIASLILAGIVTYKLIAPVPLENTDTILMQEMIDTQEGVINQEEHIILPDKVETKTEYTVHVQYAIIDKESDGKTLFTTKEEPSDELAYVAGNILETTTTHYPTKTRVNVYLSMISSATPITNKKGEPINIKKQQLVPMITIEKATE